MFKLTVYQKYRIQRYVKKVGILLLIIAIAFIVNKKGMVNKDKNKLKKIDNVINGTGQHLTGVTLTAYDDTVKVWVLKTDNLSQDDKIKRINVHPVNLTMYNDSGVVTTTVVSDSGFTTEKMDFFHIWGHVTITDKDTNKMFSNSLSWNKKERLLTSPDIVTIKTHKGEILQGRGFEASEDFSWWEFKQDVSGKFNNIEDEFSSEDTTK